MSCRNLLNDLAQSVDRTPDGWMQLRVESPPATDLFLAVRHPDRCPALIVEVATDAVPHQWKLPAVRGLEIVRGSGQHRGLRLAIIASQPSFWDQFVAVVDDLLAALSKADSASHALQAVERRLGIWAAFFDRAPSGLLTREERLGLIGELFLLKTYLMDAIGDGAVRGWHGPESEAHDFVFEHASIEVKCSLAQQPVHLGISSVRQLEDEAVGALFLFGLLLVEGANGDVCLPELVEQVRTRISAQHPAELARLDDLLLKAGYSALRRDEYAAERFNVRNATFFHVRGDGFPRMREASVPAGVGNLRYTIDWSACLPYAVPSEFAIESI